MSWAKVSSHQFWYVLQANAIDSLGWMELRTVLAKLHYTYNLKLLDEKLEWQAQSRMHTLWQKPRLMVEIRARERSEE